MALVNVRVFTSAIVIAISALAIWLAAQIVRFSRVDDTLGSGEAAVQAVRPWLDIPGIAFNARRDAFDATDEKLVLARRARLADILSVRPLAPNYWLAWSRTWLDGGENSEQAVDGLVLSQLTGPNELTFMTERGLVGIRHWEELPAEVQRHTVVDLAGSRPLNDEDKTYLRTSLSEKTDRVREDIANALAMQGFSPQERRAIGL